MNSQYEDYKKFTVGTKSEEAFNSNLKRKLKYLESRLQDLEEHFHVVMNDRNFKIQEAEFEGIFVINTQTHIMYANEFKIYNLDRFERRISVGKDWPDLLVPMIKGSILASYPYYRKPFENDFDLDDDGPVDEYGFPLEV